MCLIIEEMALFRVKGEAFLFRNKALKLFFWREFYTISCGDNNRSPWSFRISADFFLSTNNFKDSKISKLKAISFSETFSDRIQKFLDNPLDIFRIQPFFSGDFVNDLFFCDGFH